MTVDWGAVISAASQIAGAAAQSKAAGRAAEAAANQRQDVTAQSGYATDKSLDLEALVRAYSAELDRAKGVMSEYEQKLAAPQARASNAVRGDVLANLQDVGVSGPPGVNVVDFSGGLRPSILSGNSRALGAQMSKEALLDALDGKTPTPYSSMAPLNLSSITARSAPEQTPLPQASRIDKVMEAIGLYGGLAAGIGGAMNPSARAQAQAQTIAGQLATNTQRGINPNIIGVAPNTPQWGP